jgi:hypothetical protein
LSRTQCARKPSAEAFPKNFALIRLAEKQSKQKFSASTVVVQSDNSGRFQDRAAKMSSSMETLKIGSSGLVEEMCPEHGRKLEIVCIQDRKRICANCALFGSHKNHDIRQESEVMSEITLRTEMVMQMYEMMELSTSNRIEPAQVAKMAHQFQKKANELNKELKDRFREMQVQLKIQE